MATMPPEVPAQPSSPSPAQPGQPQPGGPEVSPPGPDIDAPSTPDIDVPSPQPGGDPGAPAQPIGFAAPAAASRTGERAPGDTDDIGSTDAMGAAHGDLAGTSR